MKKLIVAIALILTASISMGKATYLPSDYDQFKETGSCPSCDLSSINNFYVNYGTETPFNLKNANLSESTIHIANNTLSDYSGVTAVKTSFTSMCYTQANFQNSVLIDADFRYTNLTYANFDGADVRGADFSKADLYGAHGINFPVVKSVCDAVMPDGSIGKCN